MLYLIEGFLILTISRFLTAENVSEMLAKPKILSFNIRHFVKISLQVLRSSTALYQNDSSYSFLISTTLVAISSDHRKPLFFGHLAN